MFKNNLLPKLQAWDIMPEAVELSKKRISKELNCEQGNLNFVEKDTFNEV